MNDTSPLTKHFHFSKAFSFHGVTRFIFPPQYQIFTPRFEETGSIELPHTLNKQQSTPSKSSPLQPACCCSSQKEQVGIYVNYPILNRDLHLLHIALVGRETSPYFPSKKLCGYTCILQLTTALSNLTRTAQHKLVGEKCKEAQQNTEAAKIISTNTISERQTRTRTVFRPTHIWYPRQLPASRLTGWLPPANWQPAVLQPQHLYAAQDNANSSYNGVFILIRK